MSGNEIQDRSVSGHDGKRSILVCRYREVKYPVKNHRHHFWRLVLDWVLNSFYLEFKH